MRTACSSSHHWGGLHTPPEQAPPGAGIPQSTHPLEQAHPPEQAPPSQIPLNLPLGVGLDQISLNFPLGCWPTDPLPPGQILLNFPLGVGLETCKACWDTTPPPPKPAARYAGIPPAMHAGIAHPPVDRHTPVKT